MNKDVIKEMKTPNAIAIIREVNVVLLQVLALLGVEV
jgi:hypothetical protein